MSSSSSSSTKGNNFKFKAEKQPRYLLLLSFLYLKLDRYEKVVESCNNFLSLNGKNANDLENALYFKGVALCRVNKRKEATEIYQQICNSNPFSEKVVSI